MDDYDRKANLVAQPEEANSSGASGEREAVPLKGETLGAPENGDTVAQGAFTPCFRITEGVSGIW
jgi:hypothetical protein